jgi:adenosylcobinamide-phosphate synthase
MALALTPHAGLLALAVMLDLWLGDPVYAWHPVRLMGRLLTLCERLLRAAGADGHIGGVVLFLLLATCTLGGTIGLFVVAASVNTWLFYALHVFLIYSLLALGDLFRHVWRIEAALRAGDRRRARLAVQALVGRDTEPMDDAACRRAAVESLSENLTDGFVSPLCWYALGGPIGLVLFKLVSTMDSMVGYMTPRYRRFGWCGARLDDVMNYVPARLTWLAVSIAAAALPGFSGRKAWRVGLAQHGVLPGPNAGWSEAAVAGALGRRLVGPIWLDGTRVTERWLGEATDAPLSRARDTVRALILAGATAAFVAGLVCGLVAVRSSIRG